MKQHVHDSKSDRCKDRPLYKAFAEYGIDSFSIEPLEITNSISRYEREQYWIQKYRTYDHGYNATYGGSGKPFVDESLLNAFWLRGMTVIEIAKRTGLSPDTISGHLERLGVTKEERHIRANQSQGKKVEQLDQNGSVINSYPSLTSAGVALGLTNLRSSNHIAQVCNGKRETAFGYKWRWSA